MQDLPIAADGHGRALAMDVSIMDYLIAAMNC
jgi:hypothetical protein